MRNILVCIRYIGTNYCGYGVQKNGISIQSVLQQSLMMFLNEKPDVTGCSRTDSKVHANEYYFTFKTENKISCEKIALALDRYLPSDIGVINVCEKGEDFHPRYSCKSKVYKYVIYNGQYKNPFYKDRALFINYRIDMDKLNEALKKFEGRHDFKAFMSKHTQKDDTIREVYSASAERAGELIEIKIHGNGFLHNMVRIMVGTALSYERGRLKLSIEEILDKKDRSLAGVTAPAHGLYLDKVFYQGEIYDKKN